VTDKLLVGGCWASGIKGLLLDLDGTLVDSVDAIIRGWRLWGIQANAPVDRLSDIVHRRSAAAIISCLLPGVTEAQLRDHIDMVSENSEIRSKSCSSDSGIRDLS